jgi:hypothetical protein
VGLRHAAAALLALGAMSVLLWSCGENAKSIQRRPLPTFDAERAFADLVRQVEFGPRVPETEAHQQCLTFLETELRATADRVVLQPFQAYVPGFGKSMSMTNVIASFDLEKTQRILLAAHWDSRPWADQDPDPANHDKPIPGANDGASGVAVLLEIARIIQNDPPDVGIDIVLFDGEDSGSPGQPDTYTLGAQYFARNKDVRYNPMAGLLLDMVGDRDLQIYQEGNSWQYARSLVERVWGIASILGVFEFIPEVRYTVTDDHVPLLRVGVPIIDLIDFEYGPPGKSYWHTLEDTPDKCSPESLGKVGRVVLGAIYWP